MANGPDKTPDRLLSSPTSSAAERLRNRAEELIQGQANALPEIIDAIPVAAVRQLLHELQVHQIELEMQNEELQRAQIELEASRARYFDLYDLAPVGYVTLSNKGLILEANLTFADFLGVTRTAMVRQPLSRFVLPADQDRFYKHLKDLRDKSPGEAELRLIGKDAVPLWTRLESNRTLEMDGTVVFRITISNISKGKADEERLRQAAAMFENAREGVMVTDAEEHILLVNHAFCELTGFGIKDVLGQTPRLLKSGRQDKPFYAALWADIDKYGSWRGEIWNRRKTGEVYPQLLSISRVLDDTAKVSHYVGVFSDITLLKDVTARLDFMVHHDALTGLPNRLLLLSRLNHGLEVARRERKLVALLMLDLDRFKDVNDSYGHVAGDELLQKVAERLTTRLRGIDTISRLGGDEFAVLLEDLPHPRDAAFVAREIIDAVGAPWRLANGTEVRIGASVGISLYPNNGQNSEELLQQADAAMYLAKSEGRGTFKYFSDDLTQAALRRINLESLLRRAIARNELIVHYQPKVEVASGRIVGAEALLRWNSFSEGVVPPNQFIPVAEETGQINLIGGWVLGEVCRQGQCWLDAGLPALNLAVNLSPHQFRHGDIGETVAKILAETGFPAGNLELELTESALMEREEEAAVILQSLRTLGVRLAIDDFGTGYSSLAYLKRFPLDILKIDKRFIDDIPQAQDDREIAAAIISMGHTLRLKVLAEGVETREQLDFLKAQGCDFYQGYYYSPAVAPEAFASLLEHIA